MNYVDVLILATVALTFGLGLISGFVTQVAGMVALLIGVFASILLGPVTADALGRWVSPPALANILAYLALFGLASMAVRILAVVFAKMLERFKLEKLNRLAGGLVGLAKGFVICAVVIVILSRYKTSTRTAVDASLLGGIVVASADYVMGKADEYDVTEKMKDAKSKLEHAAETTRDKSSHIIDRFRNRDATSDTQSGDSADALRLPPKEDVTP